MPSYIFQLHGDYFQGAKRTWFAERLDEETDLETTLTDIEDQEKVGRRLVRVIEVESLRDVTDEFQELLGRRADDRRTEERLDNQFGDRTDHARALQGAE